MDVIESLAKQASQITMYDIKSYYNQAKNAVLNIPEMEAKVREATNEDPWGASSTLMKEIAEGTHNFQHFNEIMPTIYSRFMEKEAREWRQIYKSLTLLEYLIKHGSERVVDDARAHVSTIKMLRNFHYVDERGKDQGINVRNRAKEIAELLSDVDKIRAERRKAKANRNKYQGAEGGSGGMSFTTASGSRYGGFGSDSVGGGGGGSGGGSRDGYDGSDEYRSGRPSPASGFRDTAARQEYDEYEGADDFDAGPPRRTSSVAAATSGSRAPQAPPKPVKKELPKPAPKAPEVNLFDFDDEPVPVPAAAPAPAAAATPVDAFGDDDFDDFQQAPNAPLPAAAPVSAVAPTANSNLFALLESSAPSAPAAAPSYSLPAQPNRTPSLSQPSYGYPAVASRPSYTSSPSQTQVKSPAATPAPTKPASVFDDLWTTSLGSPSLASPPVSSGNGNKTIAQMEKEKAMSSLWGPAGGAAAPASSAAPAKPSSSTFDDLLL